MVTSREDGPLLATIVSLIVGVFGGYGPSLSTIKSWHLEWFWRVCPGVCRHQQILFLDGMILTRCGVLVSDLVIGGILPCTYRPAEIFVRYRRSRPVDGLHAQPDES